MYGESWWTPEEEQEEEMEGSYNPRALEPEEPVYSEPNFAREGEELVPPHLSSPDSGYLSFGRPGLSSCSSDTEGSLASLAPGKSKEYQCNYIFRPIHHEPRLWAPELEKRANRTVH